MLLGRVVTLFTLLVLACICVYVRACVFLVHFVNIFCGMSDVRFAQTDFLKYLDTREKEQDPTEAELKWVIQMATPEVLSNLQLDSEWVRGEMQLEGEGLETAAMCWRSYTDTSKFIEPVFDEISQSKDAALSKQQLAEVLKRLNEDVEPLEDEVSFVMSKADILGDGVIQRPELMLVCRKRLYTWQKEGYLTCEIGMVFQAISVWYTLHEGLLRVCDLPGQDKKPPPPPHQSKGRVHVSRVSQSSVKAITGYQRSRHRRSSSDSPRNRVDESTLELFRHFDVEFKAGAVRAAKRQEQVSHSSAKKNLACMRSAVNVAFGCLGPLFDCCGSTFRRGD